MGSHTAPSVQTEPSSPQKVVPNPSHDGLRKKKGKGTSNQKSREAKRKSRAKLSRLRLGLSILKMSESVAFLDLAVPKSLFNPKTAHGRASKIKIIMTAKAKL
mmetsp:Transcript_17104/g.46930  ORF Transcript_17104/g.46930 Transcript_17104/m.46930 type:complete len:103 (+) Transcript_17104:825-1133(+)